MAAKTQTPVKSDARLTLNREAAETLTAELRQAGIATIEARRTFAKVIAKAYNSNVAEAMGFASWSAYAQDVFGASMTGVKMTKSDRESLVALVIQAAGEEAVSTLSARALAAMLGCSLGTASAMRKFLDLAPTETIGRDGKVYRAEKNGKGKSAESSEGEGEGEGEPKGKTKPKGKPGAEKSISEAKTDELRGIAQDVIRELSRRWSEGDEAAETALAEMRAALDSLA